MNESMPWLEGSTEAFLRFQGRRLELSERNVNPNRSRQQRLRGAGCDAKLRGAYVRVRTVLSENERLTLTISRLIV
jgi:hypothetical protein